MRAYVYVGTYTQQIRVKLFLVDGRGEGIHVFALDPENGALEPVSVARGVLSPALLAIAPNRRWLYSVNESDSVDGRPEGAVSAFAIDPSTGALEFLNRQPTGGQFPAFVAVDATSRAVLVANHETGSLACFPIQPDGRLGAATEVIQHSGSSVHPRHQLGPHVHSVNVDPTNRYVIACDKGIDRILVYRLDASTARLALNDPPGVTTRPGAGPRHLAFHPSGRFAFVINELDATLTAFAFDPSTGALSECATLPTLPADYSGPNMTADIAMHPSGRFVYGSNRGHNSVAAFAFDERTGTLTGLGNTPTGGELPRAIGIDPTGRLLLAANQNSDTIVPFAIDQKDGSLTPTGAVTRTPTPVCIRFLSE